MHGVGGGEVSRGENNMGESENVKQVAKSGCVCVCVSAEET